MLATWHVEPQIIYLSKYPSRYVDSRRVVQSLQKLPRKNCSEEVRYACTLTNQPQVPRIRLIYLCLYQHRHLSKKRISAMSWNHAAQRHNGCVTINMDPRNPGSKCLEKDCHQRKGRVKLSELKNNLQGYMDRQVRLHKSLSCEP